MACTPAPRVTFTSLNERYFMMTEFNRPLVAIVDDDESVREAMESLIRSIGCRAESHDSAEEFLLSGRLPETDCLILDLKMPGMGGMALHGMLAGINPPLPTVFITAHWDEETRMEAKRLGAVDFLRKPCSDDALIEAVRLALEAAHAHKGN
jgi:FixJ family two-component response regulator